MPPKDTRRYSYEESLRRPPEGTTVPLAALTRVNKVATAKPKAMKAAAPPVISVRKSGQSAPATKLGGGFKGKRR